MLTWYQICHHYSVQILLCTWYASLQIITNGSKVSRSYCSLGYWFKHSKPLTLSEDDYKQGFFPTTSYDIPDDPTLKELFNIDINTNKLVGFVDAAHANDLRKHWSTTRVVFTLSSFTEAEFIAAHAATKIARYLQMLLKQLGFEQIGSTPIKIDNLPALKMLNDNTSPTEHARHIDVWYF